ncbi:MAG: hypothetical protein QM709_07955 [Spongiibacteraceae bacterium]
MALSAKMQSRWSAKKLSRWLIAVLIVALVLPWCRVLCTTVPVVSAHDHCAGHMQTNTDSSSHKHISLAHAFDCEDGQQSITANHYTSLDSIAKQLPILLAIASAVVFIFAIFDSSSFAFLRTRSPAAPPIRRHLLLCVIRD